ncbi:hypothetical protein EHQ27_07340 [Leptospira wolffii]|uniref:Lp29 family lipoprotein n=1 Tax=Leptospira wolffii TaxID=409998 RepID=UPI001082E658|nr:hypothetical protein [Leptospira wolffii]TGK56169.1 hypothetical protein EHQ32_17305 [Leptospira wolffii]TGK72215.1 hypothetical protein EHQ35_12740 [Leptospira wolffii]TGK72878.1 hypothetical protein EHQ27_07340 [Leptospira wolffii]TGL27792.1 hypothetical protein EHQ57_15565 [Leptospira wolffii]
MKRILITSVLILNACITHFPRENTYPGATAPTGKKIALIAFYPIREHIIPSETKGSTFSRGLVYSSDLSSLFPYGKRIDTIPSAGIDNGISQENIKKFVDSFKIYKDAAKTELEKVFEIRKGADGKDAYTLKRRNVDYYIVARLPAPVEGHRMQTAGGFVSMLKLLTMFPAAATLSTIPLWEDEFYLNNFLVYDNKLNLVKFFTSDYKINRIFTWWGERSYKLPPNYEKIYAPDGHDLGAALVPTLDAYEKGQKTQVPDDPLQFLTR